ncbi:unnamed protein product, partial [Musa acuminata subsp. burmannicoides]
QTSPRAAPIARWEPSLLHWIAHTPSPFLEPSEKDSSSLLYRAKSMMCKTLLLVGYTHKSPIRRLSHSARTS